MKNLNLRILIIWILLIGCKNNTELNNSIWELKMGECVSYIHFISNQDYEYFDCELNENFQGLYNLTDDIILIEQLDSEFDEEFHGGSKHRAGADKYKLLVDGGAISFIQTWDSSLNLWKDLNKDNNTYTLKK